MPYVVTISIIDRFHALHLLIMTIRYLLCVIVRYEFYDYS